MATGQVPVRLSATGFAELARDLRRAGAQGLQRELHKSLQRAARPMKPAVIESAQANLPKSGGRGRRGRRLVRTGATLTNAVSGRAHEVKRVQLLSNRDGSAKLSDGARDSVAARVSAATFVPRVSSGPQGSRLRFVGTERRGKKIDLSSLDRGRLRHPTFGRRTGPKDWHDQAVPAGWFTKPLQAQAQNVGKELQTAVDALVDQINRA